MENRTQVAVAFDGSSQSVAGLIVKNTLLTLVTFGIYSAWAKTNIRKYFWSHISLMGNRLHYSGTGEELFWAYLKIAIIYACYSLGAGFIQNLFSNALPIIFFFLLCSFALYTYLYGRAIYGGFRYILSRTSMNGIRFGVRKQQNNDFVIDIITGSILSGLTFGIYLPFHLHRIDQMRWNNASLGQHQFRYEGSRADFVWGFYFHVFFVFITFGLYIPWFLAWNHRFLVENLKLGNNTTFQTTIEGVDLFLPVLFAWILTTMTFGLAAPWALFLLLQEYSKHLLVNTDIDFSDLKQNQHSIPGSADEVLGHFLDVEADFI